MRMPLIEHRGGPPLRMQRPEAQPITIQATAPPGDRTSRTERYLHLTKAEWSRAYDLAKDRGLPASKALRMAAVAYKLAMPRMDSLSSIRAAIACTAQGITLEVFDGRDGSQLLYAAQVALATLKPYTKKR